VAQLNQYFPKLCPPTCGLEINFRRIKDNPRIKVFTMAEVEKVEGAPGNYNVAVRINPRYVNERCTLCGECAKACATDISDEFNFGMNTRKGAFLPLTWPFRPGLCSPSRSSAPMMPARPRRLANTMRSTWRCRPRPEPAAGAVVWATGWEPYDASRKWTTWVSAKV
jgi:quinone-modifying oxidoreductase, subunit QmoA